MNSASKLGEDKAQGHEILVTDAVKTALEAAGTGVSFEVAGTGFSASESVYRVTG